MSGMKDALLGDTPYMEMFAPFQAHSTTSREAAHSIQKHIGPLHERVLKCFRENPQGLTDEQLIDLVGRGASTIRPRRIELVDAGLLHKTERYALTKSGRRATVWEIA